MKQVCYLGVDVGTGSVRAGLFDARGELLGSATNAITTWRSDTDHRIYEQSTGDIWKSVCLSVKEVLSATGFGGEDVKGIGFDATCSLAVIDLDNQSILVTGGEHCGNHGERNVILWADHRAEQEAELINKTGSVVLQYVGGTMSVWKPILIVFAFIVIRLFSSRWRSLRSCGSRIICREISFVDANSLIYQIF